MPGNPGATFCQNLPQRLKQTSERRFAPKSSSPLRAPLSDRERRADKIYLWLRDPSTKPAACQRCQYPGAPLILSVQIRTGLIGVYPVAPWGVGTPIAEGNDPYAYVRSPRSSGTLNRDAPKEETTMKRRPGITLIEVLVAIFIMAIGLLALLTLFPLGHCGCRKRCRTTARPLAPTPPPIYATPSASAPTRSTIRPGSTPSLFVTPPTAGFQTAAQSGGGIPIYIDPWGVTSGSGPARRPPPTTAPTPATPGIWRLCLRTSILNSRRLALPRPMARQQARYFTLLDDMTFLTNGLPDR